MERKTGRSAVVLPVLLLVLAGCIPKRVVWSPDGNQAAVMADKGLYLCDVGGKLSALLVPDVSMAEWFADSHHLALVKNTPFKSWAQLENVLPPETRDRVSNETQVVLGKLKAGVEFNNALATVPNGAEFTWMCICLKSLDGVKPLSGANWDFLNGIEQPGNILLVGTVADGKVTEGPVLASGLREIWDVRVAPDGMAIAWTEKAGDGDDARLMVVPTDGSKPPQLVAEQAAVYTDWSKDGHSLVYIRAVVAAGAGGKDLRLASLDRRAVLDPSGRVNLQSGQDELVGLLFEEFSKIRCLQDGRILFSASEVKFPSTSLDMPQGQQLFSLDPERQATITPLIPPSVLRELGGGMLFYESSPDGRRISIGGDKGAVFVLTLASGNLDVVQPATGEDAVSAPVWRTSNELCFIAVPKTNDVVQQPQVALWKDGQTRLLSGNWPKEVRVSFLDK